MEVARAGDKGQDEEEAYPRVQCPADDPPHQRLAESADEGQHVAHEVELADLCTYTVRSCSDNISGLRAIYLG